MIIHFDSYKQVIWFATTDHNAFPEQSSYSIRNSIGHRSQIVDILRQELFRHRGSTDLTDNFPFIKKIGCFCKAFFKFYFQKQHSLLLNGEVIWQASDSSLTKELQFLRQKSFKSICLQERKRCSFCDFESSSSIEMSKHVLLSHDYQHQPPPPQPQQQQQH